MSRISKLTSGTGKPCSIRAMRRRLSGTDSALGEARSSTHGGANRAARIGPAGDVAGDLAPGLLVELARHAENLVGDREAVLRTGRAQQIRRDPLEAEHPQPVEIDDVVAEEAAVVDDETGTAPRHASVGDRR